MAMESRVSCKEKRKIKKTPRLPGEGKEDFVGGGLTAFRRIHFQVTGEARGSVNGRWLMLLCCSLFGLLQAGEAQHSKHQAGQDDDDVN